MQIEEYFNFLSDNDIRIQGSRIGIETVLYEFICKIKRLSVGLRCLTQPTRIFFLIKNFKGEQPFASTE